MSFAEELKKYRNTAGLSKQTLAERMSIPLRTIEDWEAGRREPAEYLQGFVLKELKSIIFPEYPYVVYQCDERTAEMKIIGGFNDKYHAEIFMQGMLERDELHRTLYPKSTVSYSYTITNLKIQGYLK